MGAGADIIERLLNVIEAQDNMITAYRTRGHPSRKTWDVLDGKGAVIDEARRLLAGLKGGPTGGDEDATKA